MSTNLININQNDLNNHNLQNQQFPIIYTLFGQNIPEDYLIRLNEIKQPIKFIKNPVIKRKFTRQLNNMQKSDYFRLEYIYQHGGIYSDIDNVIDYKCMKKVLKKYKQTDSLVFIWLPTHNREFNNITPNNFIYSSKPYSLLLKRILDQITQTNINHKFAGNEYLSNFPQITQDKQLLACIKHNIDYKWQHFYQKQIDVLKQNNKKTQNIMNKKLLQEKVNKNIKQKEKIQKENNKFKKKIQQLENLIKQQEEEYKKQTKKLPLSKCDKYLIKINNQNINNKNRIKVLQQRVNEQSKQLHDNKKKHKELVNKLNKLNKKNKQLNLTRNVQENQQNNEFSYILTFCLLLILIISIFFIKKLKKSLNFINSNQKINSSDTIETGCKNHQSSNINNISVQQIQPDENQPIKI